MRTLSSLSRAFGVAAIIATACLMLGGAYLAGYVGELQRALNDPAAARNAARQHIAAVEQALGHAGFLKTYRNYRLTGDADARLQLTQHAIEAGRALAYLKEIYGENESAADALREAESVGQTFAHVAQTAPETGSAALRGTAAMNDLATLPQPPQLEATYLALRAALDRLTVAELDRQLGGAATALNWSQVAIIAAIGTLVAGLLVVAGLLQMGIIQPLTMLERSLTSAGDGMVAQKIWGTERTDEFGTLARAGEKLRHALTETPALKTLAEKGQLHLTLDSQSSVLLQRLADDVTGTASALKAAAADFAKLQDTNRHQLDTALGELTTSAAGANQAADAMRQGATATVKDLTAASAGFANAAKERLLGLDRLTAKFEQDRDQIAGMAASVRDRTTLAAEELSASATSLKTVADGVGQIEATLTQSYAQISADAVKTTDKVATLTARLSETIGAVDERLGHKLAALDALEHTVIEKLAKLRAKADEASLAMTAKAGQPEQHPPTVDDSNNLKAAIARLDEIAGRLANPAQEPAAAAPDLHALANALQGQLESVRSEIRDLAIRMTEERLLASADTGLRLAIGNDPDVFTRPPQRTLADVPGAEIMARLKDLAAEMNAAQDKPDHTALLKTALGRFAAEVKGLATGAARLNAMGCALDQHAEEIEAHMPAVEPSTALRTELQGITGELRVIAAQAQTSGTKDGAGLRESAIEIGARAESLFTYLNETHPGGEVPEDEFEPPLDAANDIAALTQLIDRIEARATSLAAFDPNLGTNGSIHLVFESIGRLNNIATALSRAGHAERQRHATH